MGAVGLGLGERRPRPPRRTARPWNRCASDVFFSCSERPRARPRRRAPPLRRLLRRSKRRPRSASRGARRRRCGARRSVVSQGAAGGLERRAGRGHAARRPRLLLGRRSPAEARGVPRDARELDVLERRHGRVRSRRAHGRRIDRQLGHAARRPTTRSRPGSRPSPARARRRSSPSTTQPRPRSRSTARRAASTSTAITTTRRRRRAARFRSPSSCAATSGSSALDARHEVDEPRARRGRHRSVLLHEAGVRLRRSRSRRVDARDGR